MLESSPSTISLAQARAEFGRSRLLAMPIAGTIGWTAAGIIGALASEGVAALSLFIIGGMIFFLGVLIGRLIGDDIIGGQRKPSELDQLFILTILMANLSWAIAIPFFMVLPSSLPLSLGVLSGAMWLPLSWMMQHWVGMFHAVARTILVVAAWFLFPEQRFVAIPIVIVLVYAVSIVVLATRKLPTAQAVTP